MQVGKQAAALWKSKAEDAMQQVRLFNPAGATPDVAHHAVVIYTLVKVSSHGGTGVGFMQLLVL